ncbi:hypothetical protein NIIDMKKI_17690 [Mycobacterium kansasii]|uniref:Uncharacterized protein n=1 Tax=Mycobacterium kansasii TaxID=1768 RepID=A0A7G1I8D6_MYCKA|nr:hypothetical protein NIIDMKKI_17690 [Mycobacterium kansasii]
MGLGYVAAAQAALAGGDVAEAQVASEAAWRYLSVAQPKMAVAQRGFNAVEAARALGDLTAARSWADDAVAVATGWHRVAAYLARARVATAQGLQDLSERDAHDALTCAADSGVYLHLADTLDCLADLGKGTDNCRAARLSARPMPVAGGWGRCCSRSTNPTTRRRWPDCETRWVITISMPHGQQARP